MGRTRNEVIRSAFDYDPDTKLSKCKVQLCQAVFSGSYLSNLSRHLKMKHPTIYEDLLLEVVDEEVQKRPQKRSFQVAMSEEEVKEACLHAITIEGKPLSYLDDLSFRTFAETIFKGLKMNVINSHNITSVLEEKFQLMIENLKKITHRKLISLKIDSATRQGKQLFCVNMQLVNQQKINISTLGIVPMNRRSTAENLVAEIKNILNRLDISDEQVFSVTSDNGRNMVRAVEMLREGDEESEGYDEDWAVEIVDTLRLGAVPSIRCAPHTLQLAVEDFLNASKVENIISAVREYMKKMRAPNQKMELEKFGFKRPILDVPTRWNTTYEMLRSFKELRPFWSASRSAQLSSEDLAAVDMVLQVLGPVKSATLQLQREQLPLGDFIKVWWGVRLSLEKNTDNFSKDFLNYFGNREKLLMENDMVLAALYLDPRLRRLLPDKKMESTRLYLKKIATQMLHVKLGSTPSSSQVTVMPIQPASSSTSSMPATLSTISASTSCAVDVDESTTESLLDSFLSSMGTGSSDEERDVDGVNTTICQELGLAAGEIDS